MVNRLILSEFDCQGLVICHPGEKETQSQFQSQNGFSGQRPSPWRRHVKWRLCHRIQFNKLPSVSVCVCMKTVLKKKTVCVRGGVCKAVSECVYMLQHCCAD